MRKVTYSMGMTLDGFVMDSEGSIDWGAPSDEVFRFSINEIQDVGVHLMGRKLYETMLYWETAAAEGTLSGDHLEWANLWNPLPKVVFSNTLTSVVGNSRLATGTLAEEIERLRADGSEGDIAIGGAALAAQAAELDLIDAYRVRVFPVLVGGGVPFFAHLDRKVELELEDTRVFESGVVYLRHRVVRSNSA